MGEYDAAFDALNRHAEQQEAEKRQAATENMLARTPSALIRMAASAITIGDETRNAEFATKHYSRANALAGLAIARMMEAEMQDSPRAEDLHIETDVQTPTTD